MFSQKKLLLMKFQLLFSVAVVWCHVFAYRLEKTNSMYYITFGKYFFSAVFRLFGFFFHCWHSQIRVVVCLKSSGHDHLGVEVRFM